MNLVPAQKVLAIGLDSCDLEYLQAYITQLPNLQKLLGKGELKSIKTTASALDASVWPSFMTGSSPGSHGYYFPFQWRAETLRYQRTSFGDMPLRPFWESSGDQGFRIGVLDAPMLPLPAASGAFVDYYHWQSQDEGSAYRFNTTALGREIFRKFGRNPQAYDIPTDKTPAQLERLRQDGVQSALKRGALTKWLLEESEWDLFLTCFSELHRAGHYLCPDPEKGQQLLDENDRLFDVYLAVDTAIGDLLMASTAHDARVIIFALHGMGPNNAQNHFIPKILDRLFSSAVIPQRSLWRLLREYLPAQLQQVIALCVTQPVRDWVVNRSFSSGLDWKNTPVFNLLSGGQGYLRFNLKGREKHGWLIADSEQHQQLKALIKETFLSLKDAKSGELLVSHVIDVNNKFPGVLSSKLPDLSVVWRDLPPADKIHSPTLGEFTAHMGTGRGGNHRPKAFYFCNSAVPESLSRQVTDIQSLHRLFTHFLSDKPGPG